MKQLPKKIENDLAILQVKLNDNVSEYMKLSWELKDLLDLQNNHIQLGTKPKWIKCKECKGIGMISHMQCTLTCGSCKGTKGKWK